jgi:PAS domain S-box-containing protein
MARTTRVLIVEDLPTDAELAEREVRRVIPGSEFLRVETREAFLSALATFGPDVILSDYRLPRFNGMAALKLALEHAPDTPFIMLTGSMNEDIAVECLKAGAWDYVIKEHIKRLGPAVQAGLEHKRVRREQRVAEEELKARNQGFLTVANAGVGLASIESEQETYPFIARALKELTRGALASFGLYDPAARTIRVMHTESDSGVVNTIIRELGGKRITGSTFPMSDDAYLQMQANPISYLRSLSEVTFGVIPDAVGKVLQKLLGIDRFLGVAYWLEGILYGTSLVAMRAGVPDPAPELVHLFTQMAAVSLRRSRAEGALRESEERFKRIFDSANVGKSITSPTGQMTVNKAFCDMLGYTQEELQTMPWQKFTPADDLALSEHFAGQLARGEKDSVRFTKRYIHKNGSLVWVDISSVALRDNDGTPLHFIATIVDITERMFAEAALKESEGRYRSLIVNSPDAIFVDQQDRVILANNACCKLFAARGEDQLIGKSAFDLFHPDFHELLRERIAESWDPADVAPLLEARITSLEGRPVDVEVLVAPFTFGAADATHFILRDITTRKRAEAERERLMAAIEQSGEIVYITDPEGIIQYVNPAFETVTGYTREEALGSSSKILNSGEQDEAFYAELRRTVSSGKTWKGNLVNKRKDGKPYTEEATISPVCDAGGRIVSYVAVNRDISAQRLMEEQLRQALKMETVGQLAGGVAHDFNNMLQVIITYAEMSLKKVEAGQPLHKYLLEIRRAAQRSAEITGQLLAFARKQTVSPKVLDLNDAVASTQKMIRRLIGEDIDLAWVPGKGLGKVMIDPSQLDQVLANLAVNARDAIGGVGKLTIGTANVTFDEAYCAAHAGYIPGDYLQLTVSDDGRGMSRDVQAHLFEPFFTTKEPGKGTGLGLATIYGIVRQNNGFINVYSEPGVGTTFKVYLPRVEGSAATAVEAEGAAPRGGTETVLVVEDEAAILELARESLEQFGYTVLTAGSPAEAIGRSEEYPGRIHLVITDVVMPQMNGRQLVDRLTAARAGLKCLYMSGYTADVIVHRGVLEEGVSFISKPFSLAVLAERVRGILDSPPSPRS